MELTTEQFYWLCYYLEKTRQKILTFAWDESLTAAQALDNLIAQVKGAKL